MNMRFAALTAAAVIIAGPVMAQPAPPDYPDSAPGSTCPRDELTALIDGYSAALAAHDAASLNLADDVRFTENAELLSPGDSTLWQGAGEWGLRNDLIDTERCGTLSWGVIEEGDRLVHFAVRLQTDADGAISEIEHIIGREDEFAYGPDGVLATDYIDWERILNPIERQSREAMVAAVNDYFDTFRETPDVSVPFADRCDRWENGALTTPEHGCSPYGTGLYMTHNERRFPLVDREAGIAAGFILFNSSVLDVHVFAMRNGLVEFIQAVVGPGAENMNWPTESE